ncbi:MAG TPA: GNAT family protein [Pyrinomonadaceae bacterium]|jgi:ribosomal-protein-serine acetyltransferase|nr:GNAT family protein [Pyrinomonadaceae bacterium]
MDTEELTIGLGDGIIMRPVRASDVDAVFDIVTKNYDHLRTFMEWAKPDYSRKDAEEWVLKAVPAAADGTTLNFCILRDDKMIGTIGFAYFDKAARVTEIGYWIDAAEEGKGIMGRATEKLIDLAFNDLDMNRVQIRCADANVRSAGIPQRLGFRKEGVQRQHIERDGKVYDFLIFGLLRDEWQQRNSNQ